VTRAGCRQIRNRRAVKSINHMSLSAGERLGPYQIVEAIGAGGMREVYRARDSRLCRDVALKVMKAHPFT